MYYLSYHVIRTPLIIENEYCVCGVLIKLHVYVSRLSGFRNWSIKFVWRLEIAEVMLHRSSPTSLTYWETGVCVCVCVCMSVCINHASVYACTRTVCVCVCVCV